MNWSGKTVQVIERTMGLEGEFQLQRRGSEYEIIYNGVFIMATYNGASERAAVRDALKNISSPGHVSYKILIGGLGVGYSLREALDSDKVTEVTVAELEPAIIRWNKDYFQQYNNCALNDPRTVLIKSNFRDILDQKSAEASNSPASLFHVVMIDTDNGSSWLSLPSNEYFYSTVGLKNINACLHAGGVACFWCSCREEPLENRLKEIFHRVSFHSVVERTGQEGCYYLAEKRSEV
ncbi:MAG: spermine/spermidine synthase [Dethiobacteria bacterium]|nr:spermine/spermidine synthase [Bacillota bacterium]